MKSIFIRFLLCALIFTSTDAYGFEEATTHSSITESAFLYQQFLEKYLSFYLNMNFKSASFILHDVKDGIPLVEYERFLNIKRNRIEKYVPYKISKFITSGAEAEDYPNLPYKSPYYLTDDPLYFQIGGSRASNHFHDPLNYDHPGLDNRDDWTTSTIRWRTRSLNDLTGISAANRAVGGTTAVFGQENPGLGRPANYFDWKDARRYFEKALTSREEYERSHYFALTFLSLGHVMHLVEDMAVPSHTRNDMANDHIYTEIGFWRPPNFEGYVLRRKTEYIRRLHLQKIPSPDFADLASWFDRRGLTPSGLAEYSNLNFMSLGTVFEDYQRPSQTGTAVRFEETPTGALSAYLSGSTMEGEAINHLARVSLKTALVEELLGGGAAADYRDAVLDDACYEDYAIRLLPRAVGYASGVLRNFFRGRMEAVFNLDGSLRITNLGTEEMSGVFSLYYEPLPDYRMPVNGASWTIDLPAGIGVDTPAFSLPYIPDDAPFTLVFKGKMGLEEGAVAGFAFHPPNTLLAWRIDHHNDRSYSLRESSSNLDYAACWATWSRERFLFTHAGTRTVHHLFFLYHDPAGGPPLKLPLATKAAAAVEPLNGGVYRYPLPAGSPLPLDGDHVRAFAQSGNSCGDPEVSTVLTLEPMWLSDPADDRWRHPDSYAFVPGRSELPYTEEKPLERLTAADTVAFLHSLHPRLAPPLEVQDRLTATVLVSVPLPDPDDYDLASERFVGLDPGSGFDPAYVAGDVYVPRVWQVRDVSLLAGGGGAVPFEMKYRNIVFGSGFEMTVEYRDETSRREDYWLFNPDNPFSPNAFHEEY